jgi:predicted DNA-binding transcriptional regulator AlpA
LTKKQSITQRAAAIAEAGRGSDPTGLLTMRDMADWLQVSKPWLDQMRANPNGPPYVQLPDGTIRYRRKAILAWLKKRERVSTADYPTGGRGRRPRTRTAEA